MSIPSAPPLELEYPPLPKLAYTNYLGSSETLHPNEESSDTSKVHILESNDETRLIKSVTVGDNKKKLFQFEKPKWWFKKDTKSGASKSVQKISESPPTKVLEMVDIRVNDLPTWESTCFISSPALDARRRAASAEPLVLCEEPLSSHSLSSQLLSESSIYSTSTFNLSPTSPNYSACSQPPNFSQPPCESYLDLSKPTSRVGTPENLAPQAVQPSLQYPILNQYYASSANASPQMRTIPLFQTDVYPKSQEAPISQNNVLQIQPPIFVLPNPTKCDIKIEAEYNLEHFHITPKEWHHATIQINGTTCCLEAIVYKGIKKDTQSWPLTRNVNVETKGFNVGTGRPCVLRLTFGGYHIILSFANLELLRSWSYAIENFPGRN